MGQRKGFTMLHNNQHLRVGHWREDFEEYQILSLRVQPRSRAYSEPSVWRRAVKWDVGFQTPKLRRSDVHCSALLALAVRIGL